MGNRNKQKLYLWSVCFLSVFLIILQCAFPVQAETSCPNGHSWTEWQRLVRYNDDGTVIQEDCTRGLTQYRICTVCGTTEYRTKEPWTHNFGSWQTVRNGTCIQEGLMSHTCIDCGIVEQISTGYGGHNYGDWVEMQPATCTAQGIKYAECRYCGHREYVYTDPIPHTFSEWSVKTAATDFTTGVRRRSCTVCGYAEETVYYPDGTVFYGENNDTVRELQAALNRGGYECGTPDGSFGNNTWNAIIAFESDHNLPLDGIGWPGIRKTLAEDAQTVRPSRDTEGSGSSGNSSNNNSGSQNQQNPDLKCSIKENKSYIPKDRDCYYVYDPVVLWVQLENYSYEDLSNVYCIDDITGDKLVYDPHVYPDYKSGQDVVIEELKSGHYTTIMHYHMITPEDAKAGKYVFRVYATGTDSSGNEVKSEIAEYEVKAANGSYQPVQRVTKSSTDATIELRESTQAGHWMEVTPDHGGYYFYEKDEAVRYKVLVKNDTEEPIYHVVIGYDLTPFEISPVKMPGDEDFKPYELDPEGDAHINIDVIESGESRAFYLWCAAETDGEEKSTMKHTARMTYTRQDGMIKTIYSKPCEVITGIAAESGSEE